MFPLGIIPYYAFPSTSYCAAPLTSQRNPRTNRLCHHNIFFAHGNELAILLREISASRQTARGCDKRSPIPHRKAVPGDRITEPDWPLYVLSDYLDFLSEIKNLMIQAMICAHKTPATNNPNISSQVWPKVDASKPTATIKITSHPSGLFLP